MYMKVRRKSAVTRRSSNCMKVRLETFSDIVVRCMTCEAEHRLSRAMGPTTLPPCDGERPWLGREGKEECEEQLHLLTRSASNAYFPQTTSALSVPEKGKELDERIQKVWDFVGEAEDDDLPTILKIKKPREALRGFTTEEIIAAIKARRSGFDLERKPLRTAEFEQFVSAPEETPGEVAPDVDFYARKTRIDSLPVGIKNVIVAPRLRMVETQIGFTRLEPAAADLQGQYDLGVTVARLGLTTDWLPATEIRGEGIFIELDEKAVDAWESNAIVRTRSDELASAYKRYRGTNREIPEFPGARFYMLHSLAHLIITADFSRVRLRGFCNSRTYLLRSSQQRTAYGRYPVADR